MLKHDNFLVQVEAYDEKQQKVGSNTMQPLNGFIVTWTIGFLEPS